MKRAKSHIKSQLNLNPRETSEFRTFIAVGDKVQRGAQKIGRGLKKARRPALFLLLMLGTAHAGFNIYASVLLQNELAQVRWKGEPLTLAEMAPAPVAEAQNAAPVYRRAAQNWQLSSVEEERMAQELWPSAAVEVVSDAEVRVLLGRNQAALELARQASALPEYRSDVDWTQTPPSQILLPHYSELRKLARLLGVQAIQEARAGQNDAALNDVRAIYRMSDHLKNEPMMIGFLVARAISNIADTALDEVLQNQALSPAQARAFEASLPRTDWSAFFRRAFLAERAMNLWFFENLRSDPVAAYDSLFFSSNFATADDSSQHLSPWFLKPLALLWSPFSKLDEVQYLRLWKQRLAALQPIQVPLGQTDPTANFADELPSYAIFTRSLYPAFERAYQNRDRAEVARRQRQIVLAISALRSEYNGSYPTQLVPLPNAGPDKLPLDPYNNRPFGYRSDGQNFTLYSVGPNAADDNARNAERESYTTRQNAPAGSDDIVWNYQRK